MSIDFDKVKAGIESMRTALDLERYVMKTYDSSDIFYGHGSPDPLGEAELTVAHVMGLQLSDLGHFAGALSTPEERAEIAELVRRRIEERIPLAYLTNTGWFCGFPFYVDRRVIVPRSPIGELIESGFEGILPHDPENVLDLCTGSGCIAIATALRYGQQVNVDAADISAEALEVCGINIGRFGCEESVFPILSDLYENIDPSVRYDLIVSNPPYVDAEDLGDMPKEYSYEPGIALGSGEDGLDITRRIIREAPEHLADDGVLLIEVGNSVYNLMDQYDWDFHLAELKKGGSGVFYMTRDEAAEFRDRFLA